MAGGVTPPVLQNPEYVLWYDGLHEVVLSHASDVHQKATHLGIFFKLLFHIMNCLQLFWF